MLKTGRKCTWDEIEVGEVFAYNGCWEIYIKTCEETSILLAADVLRWQEYLFLKHLKSSIYFSYGSFYKLPKSVQSLWACYK